jgi:hypothetical protein
MIENTSDRDPFIHVLGAMSDGSDGYITGMESAGQRQFVASTQIPTRMLHGTTDEKLTEMGFGLGPVVPGDPLFREATLPEGWEKRGSDHAMWSYIHDETGKKRVAIFYKAAFYDRKAHLSIAQADPDGAR